MASGVQQITAGTDKAGNYVIDLLYTSGDMYEYRVGSGWNFVWGNVQSIGKSCAGLVGVVFNWGDAYDFDGSSWYFLTGSAEIAA